MVNVGVSIVVVSPEGRILLGKRAEKGEVGSFGWNTPGGKVEEGEGIREAAVRELREEAGLEIRPEELKFLGVIESRFTKHYVTFVFLLECSGIQAKPSEEVMKWKWFREAPDDLFPPTRDALELFELYKKTGSAIFLDKR